MPDRIWLPIDRMSAAGQQIMHESDNLHDEATWRLQNITSSLEALPSAMQGPLLEYLQAVRTATQNLVTLHHEIGDHLAIAAASAIVLDATVRNSLAEQ